MKEAKNESDRTNGKKNFGWEKRLNNENYLVSCFHRGSSGKPKVVVVLSPLTLVSIAKGKTHSLSLSCSQAQIRVNEFPTTSF